MKKLYTRHGRDPDREPGPHIALLHGARSGYLVRSWRRHELPAGPRQRRLHRHRGLEHGRVPPGRLPVGDGGQGAGREGHPRRPAVHPHQRRRRPARAAARGQRHRVPRRPDQVRAGQRAVLQGVRRRLHQRGGDAARGLPGHRGPRRPVLRLRPRERALRRDDAGSTRATDVGAAAGQRAPDEPGGEAGPGGARRQQAGQHGADVKRRRPARRRRAAAVPPSGSSPSRTRRCSTRAASSRCSSGTSPATPRRWWPRSAASSPRPFAQVAEWITANSGRDRTTAFVYSVGWTQHTRRRAVHPDGVDPAGAAGQHGPPRRRDHGAARARQHPGLHRHPDAVQPAARLPGDAARRAAPVAGRVLPTEHEHGRASGATCPPTWSACSRPTGATRRRPENDFCFDYLPRVNGDHSSYRTIADMIAGQGLRLLPGRREPGRRARRTAGCSASGWPTSTGSSSVTCR